MTITDHVIKDIIKKPLNSDDYRIEIINLINSEFLRFSIGFFKEIFAAKLENKDISVDWYKKTFLNSDLSAQEIAINAGLNKKTIHNMFNSSKKEIVLDVANEHYTTLHESIKNLVDTQHDIELTLTIKFNKVSVDLNISESLIVINTLAVKRSELRGGLWSTAGKRVEKPLMETICRLYNVPAENYDSSKIKRNASAKNSIQREVDFYLIKGDNSYKCEVKLMGKGNPESADAAIARDSKIFIADKLSDTNKMQLDRKQIKWVELRSHQGFRKFSNILKELNIPYTELPSDDLDKRLKPIFKKIFRHRSNNS
ncbi:hypothetical protein COTS27_00153 [Spirochaetota bacterium]|nr:hypothetical protein COTS27_00153 [Spirochaetota bacterium]